jgi:hypothetical protein
MKSSAAFALGLWTGAVVVAALWVHRSGDVERLPAPVAPEMTIQLSQQADKIRELELENARLTTEAERLKQTAAELTSNFVARASVRRIPFQRPSAAADAAVEDWIEQAVATGDKDALPRLEEAALQNDEHALEALARLSDRDAGAALTRAWNSGQLSFINKVRAARYLGETLEVTTQAETLLRALFDDPVADVRLLFAAVDGIANPRSPSGPVLPVPGASRVEADYAQRVKLLDAARATTADDRLRAHEEQARDELMGRWAEAEPAAQ